MIKFTRSESQCREWIKKTFPGCFCVKWPDFKQTGLSHSAGVPDFLVIYDNSTFFVECKTWKAKSFTEAQLVVFPRMVAQGAKIIVWIKEKRGFSQFLYK